MDQLKRKRAAQAGTITRIFHRLQRLQDEEPSELDIRQLQHHISSLRTADIAYFSIQCSIEELHSDNVDYSEETESLDQHNEALIKAIALAERLIALRQLHTMATDL